jgi:hypothetical protein
MNNKKKLYSLLFGLLARKSLIFYFIIFHSAICPAIILFSEHFSSFIGSILLVTILSL